MEPVISAVTDCPAPLVQPRTRIRFGSAMAILARFRSCASWSRAPGPGMAPLPVTILTLPPQEPFRSRAGPLSARSMDGMACCTDGGLTAGAGGAWGLGAWAYGA